MRRWSLRIVAFLLLGAIVNVAVAWEFAAFAGATPLREGFYRELSSEAANAYWSQHAPADWHDAELLEGCAVESWALGRADLMVIADDAARTRFVAVGHDDAGWPSLALRFTSRHVAWQRVEQVQQRWGWQVNVSWFRNRTLPLQPLWPGFAINTVFYAVVLWLLFAGPFVVRRWRRIRRGLCPKCAYDLRGSPHGSACPECGSIVPS